ncbi:MAG TPA: hypothetical protein VFQ60_04425, partial [Patescibacteria group bacterium]|nr:hypothetical protein [Patescibacteria group bacterium]
HHDYFEFDYDRREQRESLASDVSCHEWWNGVRLLGVRPDIIPGTISIHPGLPNFETLLKGHLEQLLRPNPDSAKQKGGFYHLLQIGNQHFTEYPKRGDRMDTGAPEFVVTSVKPVQGGPFLFNTSVGGFYGYFKYGIKEVSRLAPKGANAYMFTQPIITNPPGRKMQHTTGVKFFKVEVDTSRRVIRDEDVYRDYEFMMSLID